MPIHNINPYIFPSITTVLKVYIIFFYRVGLATLLGQQGEKDIVNIVKRRWWEDWILALTVAGCHGFESLSSIRNVSAPAKPVPI